MHGSIHNRACVFVMRPRLVLGLRIIFQCPRRNPQSRVGDLGAAFFLGLLYIGWAGVVEALILCRLDHCLFWHSACPNSINGKPLVCHAVRAEYDNVGTAALRYRSAVN